MNDPQADSLAFRTALLRSERRRIYGVIVNLIFSDFPIFLVEVNIVWAVGFATGLQATSFLFTCLSLCYSGFRVWTFVMVKVIKVQAPAPSNLPPIAGSRGFDGGPGYARGSPPQYLSSYSLGAQQPMDVHDPRAGGIIPQAGLSPQARAGSQYASRY